MNLGADQKTVRSITATGTSGIAQVEIDSSDIKETWFSQREGEFQTPSGADSSHRESNSNSSPRKNTEKFWTYDIDNLETLTLEDSGGGIHYCNEELTRVWYVKLELLRRQFFFR